MRKLLGLVKAGLETEETELRIDWGEEKMRRVLRGLGYRFHRIRNRVKIFVRDDLIAWRHRYLKYFY